MEDKARYDISNPAGGCEPDRYWCEYVGGGMYDGMITPLPYLLERIEVSRLTENYGPTSQEQRKRILRELYEFTGRKRNCPLYGVVHIFQLTVIKLDEFNHADNQYGGGENANEHSSDPLEDTDENL
jgi:hypothetical protein